MAASGPGSARELARALEVACEARGVPAGEVQAAAREADERPIPYPLGSGEADTIALLAGDKPLVRQLLDAGSLSRARIRFAELGLVSEAAPASKSFAVRPGRTVIFFGRDASIVREAARLESRAEHDEELGRLLGYPSCCIAAYLEAPLPRDNLALYRAAFVHTGAEEAAGRLNGLDLGVFHWISWLPCSFACAPSLAFANAVARAITERHDAALGRNAPACAPGCAHEQFVERIDDALGARRLALHADVQVSMTGAVSGASVRVERAWPTARDRHPSVPLDPDARDAVARLVTLVRRAREVAIHDGALHVDGEPIVKAAEVVLVPFARAPREELRPTRGR